MNDTPEEKVLIVDIFFIERHLLRLIGHQHVFPECSSTTADANVRIDVGTVSGGGGSWVVKRRDGNVIVNNRDTISSLFFTVDAVITFRTTRDFWGATGADISLAEAQRSFRVKASGDDTVLQQTWAALTVIATEDPAASPMHSPTNGSLGAGSTGAGGASRALGGLVSLTANMAKHRLDRDRGGHGPRGTTDVSPLPRNVNPQIVLKCGSLLKKKDILVGWQSRYFVVYPGRLEYYVDEHAYRSGQAPRASIPLSQAEIVSTKPCVVNGGEHHAMRVEPSPRAKTFRVASERPGALGRADVEQWETELLRASTHDPYGLLHTPATSSAPGSPSHAAGRPAPVNATVTAPTLSSVTAATPSAPPSPGPPHPHQPSRLPSQMSAITSSPLHSAAASAAPSRQPSLHGHTLLSPVPSQSQSQSQASSSTTGGTTTTGASPEEQRRRRGRGLSAGADSDDGDERAGGNIHPAPSPVPSGRPASSSSLLHGSPREATRKRGASAPDPSPSSTATTSATSWLAPLAYLAPTPGAGADASKDAAFYIFAALSVAVSWLASGALGLVSALLMLVGWLTLARRQGPVPGPVAAAAAAAAAPTPAVAAAAAPANGRAAKATDTPSPAKAPKPT